MCIPFLATLMYYITSNRINIKKQQTCPFKIAYIFFLCSCDKSKTHSDELLVFGFWGTRRYMVIYYRCWRRSASHCPGESFLNETFPLVVLKQCPGLLLETTRTTRRIRFPQQYKVVRTSSSGSLGGKKTSDSGHSSYGFFREHCCGKNKLFLEGVTSINRNNRASFS